MGVKTDERTNETYIYSFYDEIHNYLAKKIKIINFNSVR